MAETGRSSRIDARSAFVFFGVGALFVALFVIVQVAARARPARSSDDLANQRHGGRQLRVARDLDQRLLGRIEHERNAARSTRDVAVL